MKLAYLRIPLLSALVLVIAGCATTGSEMDSAVYQTHRIVRKLDNDLGTTVNQLNETAADLSARVDESDVRMRQLQGLAEENQRKLDNLQRDLAQMANTLYRHLGLTPQAPIRETPPPANVMPGTVRIEQEQSSVPSADAEPELSDVLSASNESAPPQETAEATPEEIRSPVAVYEEAVKKFKEDKDYQGALEQFDEYLQRFPGTVSTPYAQYWKAECYFRLGLQDNNNAELEKAIEEYETYRQQYGDTKYVPYALHNQAGAHLRLNQKEEAIKLLRELVERYPQTEAGQRASQKLAELQS